MTLATRMMSAAQYTLLKERRSPEVVEDVYA
jgi:hypothetical protein